jgi:hypothetical protein
MARFSAKIAVRSVYRSVLSAAMTCRVTVLREIAEVRFVLPGRAVSRAGVGVPPA